MTQSFTIPAPRARDGDAAPRIYLRNGMLTCVSPGMAMDSASSSRRDAVLRAALDQAARHIVRRERRVALAADQAVRARFKDFDRLKTALYGEPDPAPAYHPHMYSDATTEALSRRFGANFSRLKTI